MFSPRKSDQSSRLSVYRVAALCLDSICGLEVYKTLFLPVGAQDQIGNNNNANNKISTGKVI